MPPNLIENAPTISAAHLARTTSTLNKCSLRRGVFVGFRRLGLTILQSDLTLCNFEDALLPRLTISDCSWLQGRQPSFAGARLWLADLSFADPMSGRAGLLSHIPASVAPSFAGADLSGATLTFDAEPSPVSQATMLSRFRGAGMLGATILSGGADVLLGSLPATSAGYVRAVALRLALSRAAAYASLDSSPGIAALFADILTRYHKACGSDDPLGAVLDDLSPLPGAALGMVRQLRDKASKMRLSGLTGVQAVLRRDIRAAAMLSLDLIVADAYYRLGAVAESGVAAAVASVLDPAWSVGRQAPTLGSPAQAGSREEAIVGIIGQWSRLLFKTGAAEITQRLEMDPASLAGKGRDASKSILKVHDFNRRVGAQRDWSSTPLVIEGQTISLAGPLDVADITFVRCTFKECDLHLWNMTGAAFHECTFTRCIIGTVAEWDVRKWRNPDTPGAHVAWANTWRKGKLPAWEPRPLFRACDLYLLQVGRISEIDLHGTFALSECRMPVAYSDAHKAERKKRGRKPSSPFAKAPQWFIACGGKPEEYAAARRAAIYATRKARTDPLRDVPFYDGPFYDVFPA